MFYELCLEGGSPKFGRLACAAAFGLDLLGFILAPQEGTPPTENGFLAPLSISTALAEKRRAPPGLGGALRAFRSPVAGPRGVVGVYLLVVKIHSVLARLLPALSLMPLVSVTVYFVFLASVALGSSVAVLVPAL